MDCIISETTFFECENVPEDMVASFDKPWKFVGEVAPSFDSGWGIRPLVIYCRSRQCLPVVSFYECDHALNAQRHLVDLTPRKFITDDMLEVIIWFGICVECGAVYWARSGPPFRRVCSYVTA